MRTFFLFLKKDVAKQILICIMVFGENWKNILLNMSIDRFNCYFDGWIHFTEEEIYDIDKFIKRIK